MPRPSAVIFVEANTSGSGVRALLTARQLGLVPIFLTSRPARYAGLCQAAPVLLECSTSTMSSLRTAVSGFMKRYRIMGITSTSEFYVVAATRLASELGLPANELDAVQRCRNKLWTRRLLSQAGLPQPRFVEVRDAAAVDAAIAAVGLPCVVKPVDDTGSCSVRRCEAPREVRAHANQILRTTENVRGLPMAALALVEEYIDGPELSIECVGDRAAQWLGVVDKRVTGAPFFVEDRHLFPSAVEGQRSRDIIDVTRRALSVVGLHRGATHTEVKLTARGPVVIEVNPRPAGGLISEVIALATGVDIIEHHLRAITGNAVAVRPRQQRAAGIRFLLATRRGTLRAIHGAEEARSRPQVAEVRVTAAIGTAVHPPRSSYDRLGHVIAHGADRADVLDALDAAHAAIDVVVTP